MNEATFTVEPIRARRIFHYPLAEGKIPFGAKPLHCGLREGQPTVWCEVDPLDTQHTRQVIGLPTGAEAPPPRYKYIGTVCGVQGFMVFHFYAENLS